MIVGVNGGGKTTSLRKLAHRFKNEGAKVLMAAGDTFGAAARDQLEVWAERTGSEIVIDKDKKAQAPSVLSQAVKRGKREGFDIVLCDTSGRLHTNYGLMEELVTCKKVMAKALPGAPNEVLLVLDGTTGLNMLQQAREFNDVVGITGFILTKLDEHQDDDLEDFRTCAVALAEENTKLKLKLEEVENSAKLSEKTTEHEHSGRNWRAEIRELKKAYKNLSSKKDMEVSALLAEKDFVWNQYKTNEKEYDLLLRKKKIEAAQATGAAKKLQRKVEELQVAAQKKDDGISRLQAEANAANKKILLLENKLQKLHSLASEEDDKTQKLKGRHLQACQKRKQDINGTHRKSRSEGVSLRGKSKNNPRRQMVENQP